MKNKKYSKQFILFYHDQQTWQLEEGPNYRTDAIL